MCQRPMANANASHGVEGLHDWEFIEPRFWSEQYHISGSIDAFFDLGVAKYMLTELKTIATEEFNDLLCPLPEHELRTKLYLRIVAEHPGYSNKINLHEGRVLYVSRGHGKKNEDHSGEILPFKEYVVQRDDNALLPILKKAEQLKTFRLAGKSIAAMPSGICATAMDKPAKSCPTCKECFSGQYPSGQPEL